MEKDHNYNSLMPCAFERQAISGFQSVGTIQNGVGGGLGSAAILQDPGTGYLDVKECSKRLVDSQLELHT